MPSGEFGRAIARPSIEANCCRRRYASRWPPSSAGQLPGPPLKRASPAHGLRLRRGSAGQLPGPPLKPRRIPSCRLTHFADVSSAGQLPGPPLKRRHGFPQFLTMQSIRFGRAIARPSIEALWSCVTWRLTFVAWPKFGRAIARPSIEAMRLPEFDPPAGSVRPGNCPALH